MFNVKMIFSLAHLIIFVIGTNEILDIKVKLVNDKGLISYRSFQPLYMSVGNTMFYLWVCIFVILISGKVLKPYLESLSVWQYILTMES